jgi:hypothetical protein
LMTRDAQPVQLGAIDHAMVIDTERGHTAP